MLLFFISFLYLHFNFDLHFVIALHLSIFFLFLLFFIHIFFATSSLTLPWAIAGFLHPFYTFSAAHRRVTHNSLIFNHSIIFLPQALWPWVGILYPQAFFTLCSFTIILTCVYQGLPGSRQIWLEVCGALYWSSKHRPNISFCLIQRNPRSSYSEQVSFKFYDILPLIACGESLIYQILTRLELFSFVQSHM